MQAVDSLRHGVIRRGVAQRQGNNKLRAEFSESLLYIHARSANYQQTAAVALSR